MPQVWNGGKRKGVFSQQGSATLGKRKEKGNSKSGSLRFYVRRIMSNWRAVLSKKRTRRTSCCWPYAQTPKDIGFIIPILQMKKMRLRQVKWVFQGHTASTWQKWDTKSKVKFFHTYLNPRIKNITAFSPWLKSANNGLWKMKSLEGKQNKNLRDNHRSFIF